MKIMELLQSDDLESRNLGIELLKTHQDYEFLKQLTGIKHSPLKDITIERWMKFKTPTRILCNSIWRILKYNGIDI